MRPATKKAATLKDGVVTTPKGFKEAYAQFVEGGWQGCPSPQNTAARACPCR
jgi:hypothetical protein